jgi:uncharacterized UBP type Zn finger protein
MIPGQSKALGVPAVSLNGTAPRCEHLDGLEPARPRSDECRDCQDQSDRQALPAALVVCLTCGWVACSDDSPNHHARAHYQETDHQVAARNALEMVLHPPASRLSWSSCASGRR